MGGGEGGLNPRLCFLHSCLFFASIRRQTFFRGHWRDFDRTFRQYILGKKDVGHTNMGRITPSSGSRECWVILFVIIRRLFSCVYVRYPSLVYKIFFFYVLAFYLVSMFVTPSLKKKIYLYSFVLLCLVRYPKFPYKNINFVVFCFAMFMSVTSISL